MTKSKNGQWIIDDPRFQFIVGEEMSFFKVKRYQYSFNSLSFIYENDDMKELESTIPRYLFKQITFSNFSDAMVEVLRKYKHHNVTAVDQNEKQRIFEYTVYLTKYYPEKLI